MCGEIDKTLWFCFMENRIIIKDLVRIYFIEFNMFWMFYEWNLLAVRKKCIKFRQQNVIYTRL